MTAHLAVDRPMAGVPGGAKTRLPTDFHPTASTVDVDVTVGAPLRSMLGHRLVQHAFEHTSTGWLLSNPPGYGPRVRDGDPLPGVSPDQVVSQLAHQVFGPLHLDRTRVVLDYHGLADRAAGTLAEIAARHGVTTRTVSLHVKAVRSVGSKLPLTPTVIAEATRRSTAAEDHLARVRIARTLALAAPHRPSTNADRTVPLTHLAPARNAMRILAADGPLDTQPLLEE